MLDETYKGAPSDFKKIPHNYGHFMIAGISLLTAFIVFLMIMGGFQLAHLFGQMLSAREEIQFAYDHPTVVKAVMVDYNNKKQALDQSFGQQSQTAQDQLLQQVTTELKSNSISK